MHFTKLVISFLPVFTLTAPMIAARFIDKDHYAQNFASIQLHRIEEYRNTHPGLTPTQSSVLDQLVRVVEEFDTSDLPGLLTSCESVFSKEDCRWILNGKSHQLMRNRLSKRDLYGRSLSCDCSTDDNWCDDGWVCDSLTYKCSVNDGCGFLWMSECDGLCVA